MTIVSLRTSHTLALEAYNSLMEAVVRQIELFILHDFKWSVALIMTPIPAVESYMLEYEMTTLSELQSLTLTAPRGTLCSKHCARVTLLMSLVLPPTRYPN